MLKAKIDIPESKVEKIQMKDDSVSLIPLNYYLNQMFNSLRKGKGPVQLFRYFIDLKHEPKKPNSKKQCHLCCLINQLVNKK